jgi:hypothetical protein
LESLLRSGRRRKISLRRLFPKVLNHSGDFGIKLDRRNIAARIDLVVARFSLVRGQIDLGKIEVETTFTGDNMGGERARAA